MTTTNSTTNTTASIYLHLQLNTSSPDPLGFALVSGFYGPGSWAGWFLTLCASWYALAEHGQSEFDPNTCLFLAGLNWAAFDLLRHLIRFRSRFHDEEGVDQAEGMPLWRAESASIGAAYTVVFWGLVHVVVQYLPCHDNLRKGVTVQRGVTLISGAVLPLVVLSSALFFLSSVPDGPNNIPALYWGGMLRADIANRVKSSRGDLNLGHDIALAWPSLFALWVLAAGAFLWLTTLLIHIGHLIPPRAAEILQAWAAMLLLPWRWIRWRLRGWSLFIAFVGIYVVSAVVIGVTHSSGFWYTWPFSFPLMLVTIFLIPLVVLQQIAGFILVYIFVAYLRFGSSPGESCFFMPCAPQSIAEFDQAFALFAGLFSFIVVEIIVPRVKKARKERKEKREFERDTQRRLQNASSTISRELVGTSGGSNGRDEAVELRPVNRMNSGIAVEEGRAGLDQGNTSTGLRRSGTV